MIPIDHDETGPSADELTAIENEWPVLAAELDVVQAECRHLLHPSDTTRRALRRADRALANAQLRAHNRSISNSPTQGINP